MTTEEVARFASQRRGWSMSQAIEKVHALLDTRKWGLIDLFLGFRADFKCEYCGLDLMSSPDSTKLWQKDHIVRGGGDEPDNLALCCLVCNCKLKNRWRLPAQINNRADRVREVQEYVKRERERVGRELDEYRRILELGEDFTARPYVGP